MLPVSLDEADDLRIWLDLFLCMLIVILVSASMTHIQEGGMSPSVSANVQQDEKHDAGVIEVVWENDRFVDYKTKFPIEDTALMGRNVIMRVDKGVSFDIALQYLASLRKMTSSTVKLAVNNKG